MYIYKCLAETARKWNERKRDKMGDHRKREKGRKEEKDHIEKEKVERKMTEREKK
jgi:hypothetical protein